MTPEEYANVISKLNMELHEFITKICSNRLKEKKVKGYCFREHVKLSACQFKNRRFFPKEFADLVDEKYETFMKT